MIPIRMFYIVIGEGNIFSILIVYIFVYLCNEIVRNMYRDMQYFQNFYCVFTAATVLG